MSLFRYGCLLMTLTLATDVSFAGEVRLRAMDGQALHATHERAGGENSEKGVILVHMDGGSSQDWEFFAGRLKRTGFQTLALNLRGHGASRLASGKPEREDYSKMASDVKAAIEWLSQRGVTDLQLVGAGIGANVALQAASEDPRIQRLVLLSPKHRVRGLSVDGLLSGYGERPLFIAVSAEDGRAARTALLLDSQALGAHSMEILSNAGSGTQMLDRDSSLASKIQAFLNSVPGQDPTAPVDLDVPPAELEGMTTEGERLPGF